MSSFIKTILCLIIPLAGTTGGAALVFILRKEMNILLQKALLGFASGVMIAASVWSLIIPAINMEKAAGGIAWVPAVAGFLCGMGFLLLLDSVIPHLHVGSVRPEGKRSQLGRPSMLVLAVTLHNIPEGMAIGVVLAGMLSGNGIITTAGAFALSVGIAVQNFPEGAVISIPMLAAGLSRRKAFLYGFISGAVEPVGAALTLALVSVIATVLPYILSFAAGAMMYVVVEELIPESQSGDHSNVGTIGTAVGFALMMLLDVALG